MRNKTKSSEHDALTQSLTHDDIRNLLLAYAGAIALDQVRADALPSGSFHPEYHRGMWQRYRQSHLDFINLLFSTTKEIPSSLLKKLAATAGERKTAVVRAAIVERFAQGAVHSLAPGQIDSAPMFFSVLVEDVGTGSSGRVAYGNHRERMIRWLAPIDPLHIADDPECGYLADLRRVCHQERQSKRIN
jgi:hypothetical protein